MPRFGKQARLGDSHSRITTSAIDMSSWYQYGLGCISSKERHSLPCLHEEQKWRQMSLRDRNNKSACPLTPFLDVCWHRERGGVQPLSQNITTSSQRKALSLVERAFLSTNITKSRPGSAGQKVHSLAVSQLPIQANFPRVCPNKARSPSPRHYGSR